VLSLNDETCIECGICADLLPQYFELADGKVRVKAGVDAGQADAALADAAADCPSGSIRR
jgi:ferredoxin